MSDTHATPEAALAAARAWLDASPEFPLEADREHRALWQGAFDQWMQSGPPHVRAILAAMPDWTLVPKAEMERTRALATALEKGGELLAWKATAAAQDEALRDLSNEIARLREIEVASQQCSGSPKHFGGCGCLCHAALAIVNPEADHA